ncbi:zinc-binding dehydrogenase [Alkalihalobacillus hwajinpoensis]|uniref:zinc-binding dehydrogenase n=1 Tax=Guptibacillus hwajinpoensis TaxID=208199 RepID=UPI001883C533|nr:zinc-binding dehydrogenase [Pseudalkalibacillus hwajinpoensis]MBF0706040.1 zinc-binding dehydrogenase [Pseudalkalibacillus hwajinpoensis]
MKTKAVRLYGSNNLKLEEFELPEIKKDEILASVKTDSICMSTWKLVQQGENHKKTPEDVAVNPIILGHEFCGDIIRVGEKWQHQFSEEDKYVIQANLQLPDRPDCPGYSYHYVGGDATYIVIPNDVMEQDCLLKYNGKTYFEGSLVEPLSTIIGAFNANYHLIEGTYNHKMGIKEHGNLIVMGGTGPMGYLAIDFAINGPKKPRNLVITGRSQDKLDKVKSLYPPEKAKENGVNLFYINTYGVEDQESLLKSTIDQQSYDDVFVFAPSRELVETGTNLLGKDGCFNFFAGPKDQGFKAEINFYDIHYNFTHYVGTSGANSDDMRQAIDLIETKKIDVSKIITHILGLNDVAETTANLPSIGGGKKLVYTQKEFDLMDLENTSELNHNDKLKKDLGEIIKRNYNRWSLEAEEYIFNHAKDI